MIHTRSFPGWESFKAFIAHLRFVKDHHQKIARVALVTDSALGDLGEHLASHFLAAEIRHFPYEEMEKARSWISAARA